MTEQTSTESVTISFIGNVELKTLLEGWAKEEESSVSSVMRRILKRERERRQQAQKQSH